MAKSVKRLSLAVLSVLLLVCLVLAGACNGGGKTVKLTFMDGETEYASVEAKPGDDIAEKLPKDPAKEGYLFGGWYSGADGTGEKQELPAAMPEQNATYYAKWSEAPKATLTLVPGAGTLEKTTYEVYVGADLAAYLKDIVPTISVEGVTFGGWYQGDKEIESGTTMSEGGLTLTAKYTVNYVVNIYEESAEGTYPAIATEVKTGTAFYGEEFEFEPEEREHFTVDAERSDVYREQLGAAEAFDVYFARERISVVYDANRGGERETKLVSVLYGATLTLEGGDIFSEDPLFRFLGWAAEEEGAKVNGAGDEVTVTKSLVLYAVWAHAHTDAFGGGDLLFVVASDEAVLSREYFDDIACGYDEATNIFTVKEGEAEIASGKVAGEFFYYFKDAMMATYTHAERQGVTLALSDKGAAVYTDGSPVNGTYAVDEETGDWIFTSETDTFFFRVDAVAKTFQTADDSRGFYGYQNGTAVGYPFFFLDGMGVARMLYPPQDPYVDQYGLSYAVLEGTYLYDAETNIFEMTVRAGGDGYLRFYIHITKSETEISGVELEGTYTLLDLVPGNYSENAYLGTEPDLFIDGLGGGSYKGRKGTYELHSLGWYNVMFGVSEISHDYIVFKPDASEEKFVFVLNVNDDGDLDYDLLKAEPERYFYDAEGLIVNGVFYPDAFLYFRHNEDEDVELWAYNEEAGELYGVDIYDSLCSGTVSMAEGEEGLYRFEGSYWNTDYSHYFRYNEDGTLRFSTEILTFLDGEDRLVIRADGRAYYTPEGGAERRAEYEVFEVAVGVTERTHIQKVYLFDLGTDGEPDIYAFKYLVEEGHVTIEAVEKQDFLDTGFLAHNTYGARVILLPENKAVVAALMAGGTYTVYFYGDVTEENGVFTFQYTFNGYPYEDGGAFETQYGHFTFKRYEAIGGYVFLIDDGNPLDIDCENGHLTTDGFGNATLTVDGEQIEGLYAFIEDLIEISLGDGTYLYVKVTGDSFKLIDLEEQKEAGYIYTVDEEGYLDTSVYFFFDGDGEALYTDAEGTLKGTYKYLGVKTLDGADFDEYEVTLEDGAALTIVVRYGTAGDQVFAVFFLRDESALFEIDVKGGGKLVCDGYDYATYTAADGTVLYGFGNLCLVADENYYNHAYAATPEGNTLVFRVLNEDRTEIVEELVFDLADEGGEKVASLRSLPFGLNVKFEDNAMVFSDYLYLDGKGNAEIRTNYGEYYEVKERGTYAAYPELGENVYQYKRSEQDAGKEGKDTFVFSLRMEVQYNPYSGILYVYEYCVYHAESDNTYYGDGYEVLKLDGFGGGVYIDKYGVVNSGTYQSTIAEGTIGFNVLGSDVRYYFNLKAEDDAFESASRGDFVVSGDVVIAYVGASTEIRIPDGVKRILQGAIPVNIASIDFNEVEILDEAALQYHYSLTRIESDTIKVVGKNAFNGTNATEIILPNAEEIGDGAFASNSSLTKLVLGKVKKIGARILERSSYMSALVIDLTGVEDLTAIEIDPAAFDLNEYTSGGEHLFFQRILVKDLAAVNTLLSSENWPEAAKTFVFFAGGEAAETSYYYSLTTQTVYRLDGALIKDVEVERKDLPSTIASTVCGLYTFEGGKLNLYLKKTDGTFEVDPTAIEDLDTLSFDGETFYRSGAAQSRTAGGKALSFTVEVAMSAENWYSSWTDIYKFSGSAVYGGAKASTFTFDFENFEITFVTDDEYKAYRVTGIAGQTCQIEYEGLVVTKEAEFAGYKHIVTLSLDDDKHITGVREVLRDFGGGNPSEMPVLTQEKHEDGSLSFELSGWQATDWFKAVYDAQNDTLTVTVEKLTRVMSATVETDEGTSASYELNFELDPEGKIQKLLSFKIQDVYPYTEWTIEEGTRVNEDGTMTIVVTDTAGTQHTFTAEIKPAGTYPQIAFTLTLTETAD